MKIFSGPRNRWNLLVDVTNCVSGKSSASIILILKTEYFRPKIRKRTRMSAVTAAVKCTAGPSQCQSGETQGIHIGKEGMKLFLVIDNVLIYMENPKKLQEEFMCGFSKVTEYKVNITK